METHFFFFLGVAFILTHEMDAIRCREWAIFPLLSRLDDQAGFVVFTAVHVPLYLLFFWGVYGPSGLNSAFIRGFDIFLIIHALLHVLFLRHPQNQFTSRLSWIIILGAAVSGLLDLLIGF